MRARRAARPYHSRQSYTDHPCGDGGRYTHRESSSWKQSHLVSMCSNAIKVRRAATRMKAVRKGMPPASELGQARDTRLHNTCQAISHQSSRKITYADITRITRTAHQSPGAAACVVTNSLIGVILPHSSWVNAHDSG